MAAAKIKCINQQYVIIADTYHFESFIEELKEKFNHAFFHEKGVFYASLSIPFSMSAAQLLQLYELCDKNGVYITSIDMNQVKKAMRIQETRFYAGESYCFQDDIVYQGDIEEDVYIQSAGNLYVIGEVRGHVDLMFPDLEISASSFLHAKIRIFDSSYQNVTNPASCKVYYKEEGLQIE